MTGKKRGAPKGSGSKYTDEIADRICQALSEGTTLSQTCRDMGIERRSVYNWLGEFPDFASRFARARELGEDAIADETLQIADDASNDFMKRQAGEGNEVEVFNAEHVQRSKLRIETRLKLLAKWNRKKWGDHITQDVHVAKEPRDMSIEELQAAIDAAKEHENG